MVREQVANWRDLSGQQRPAIYAVIGGDPLGLESAYPFDFPDRIFGSGCESAVNSGNPLQYIKTQCFSFPIPATRIGNAGRNSLIGPGLSNLDLSLVKNNHIKRISESLNIQFRAEFFNVLNHANFSPPVVNNTLFGANGAAVTTAGPRCCGVLGTGAALGSDGAESLVSPRRRSSRHSALHGAPLWPGSDLVERSWQNHRVQPRSEANDHGRRTEGCQRPLDRRTRARARCDAPRIARHEGERRESCSRRDGGHSERQGNTASKQIKCNWRSTTIRVFIEVLLVRIRENK